MINKLLPERDSRAFTLAETLVVIVILVALAAIAVPLFVGQLEKAQDAATMTSVAEKGSILADTLGHDVNAAMSGVSGDGETKIELVSQAGTMTSDADDAIVYATGGPDASWCVSKESPSGKIFALTSFNQHVTGRDGPFVAASQCASATDQPVAAPGDPGDPGAPGPIQNFSAICQLAGNGYPAGPADGWTRYVAAVNGTYGGDEAAARAGGVELPDAHADYETNVYLSWDLPAYAATSPVVSYDTYTLLLGWNPDDPIARQGPDADGNPVTNFMFDYSDPGDPTGIVVVPHFADGKVGEPEFHRWRTELDRTLSNAAGCNVVPL